MQFCPQCNKVYSEQTQFCPIDGSRLETTKELAAGSLVCGRYEIVRSLGSGAMGEVFLVTDRKLFSGNNQRAMKVPLTRFLTDKTYLDQFMNEADKTLALSHPNIVRSFHVDTAESGVPFLLMEFLEGKELRFWMDREPKLQWRHIREIALQIASALESAHAAGVVHCDVKPESVRGVSASHPTPVKVFDFGLAKAARVLVDTSSLAGSGTVFGAEVIAGTLNYMSPEQATARNRVGPPSDIYSLGVILFELVTGRLPYPNMESPAEARHLHSTQRPESLRNYRGFPNGLADLVEAMLQHAPESRPSASRVVQQLEQLQETLTPATSQQESTAGERDKVKVPGRPVAGKRPWLIPAVLTGLVIAGTLTYVLSKSPDHPEKHPEIVSSDGSGSSQQQSQEHSDGPVTGRESLQVVTPPAGDPAPRRTPELVRLRVSCDANFYWYLDGVRQSSATVKVKPGVHEVRAVMASDINTGETKQINLTGQDSEVRFTLLSLKNKDEEAQTAKKVEANSFLAVAKEAYANRNYLYALHAINRAVSLDPQNGEAKAWKDKIVKMCDLNDCEAK